MRENHNRIGLPGSEPIAENLFLFIQHEHDRLAGAKSSGRAGIYILAAVLMALATGLLAHLAL